MLKKVKKKKETINRLKRSPESLKKTVQKIKKPKHKLVIKKRFLNIIAVQPKQIKTNVRKKVMIVLSCFSLLLIILAVGGLSYAIPLIKQFNYFNRQFHDIFQNTAKYSNGKAAIPNYNYSDVNKNQNQYDNVMAHVADMTSNMPKSKWTQSKTPPQARQINYYYAMMQMEKYSFQLMPSYILQIKANEQKLIKHGKQFKNSLPMQLLTRKGTITPGKITDASNPGSNGFYVNENPTDSNVNNGASYASKEKPAGFFPDSVKIIKKFSDIFAHNKQKIYSKSDKVDKESPLSNFNKYFSSGGKSNYYANNNLTPGSNFKSGRLVTKSTQHIGMLDRANSSSLNLTSDGFVLRALMTFATDYSFTVQNYFLTPLKNQLNGVYKNGMDMMLKSHKVSLKNLLWFFYNRIVINLAASLFRQSVFAPLLFIEGRNLSTNLLNKSGKQSPIIPQDNSQITASHDKTVFFEQHANDYVASGQDHIQTTGKILNSWLFVDGVPRIPNSLRFKLFNYLPFFRVLPMFKHAADIVIISEILDGLNYVMFTQAEHIFLHGKFTNVDKNWKVLTEAEQAFKYYFETFTNISEDNHDTSPKNSGESFEQARGDFYCAADLTNPKYSEIPGDGANNLKKPLATTKYQDPNSHLYYDNYLEYLCNAAPDLLKAQIDGSVVWTSKKNKTLYQFLAEQMYEFDDNAKNDVIDFNKVVAQDRQKWVPLSANSYKGYAYYQNFTKYFSYKKYNCLSIKW